MMEKRDLTLNEKNITAAPDYIKLFAMAIEDIGKSLKNAAMIYVEAIKKYADAKKKFEEYFPRMAGTFARFEAIAKLIHEWQPARLVIGLPLSLDGAEHEMTVRCRRFANQLHGRYGLPVTLVDERLSSAEAEDRLNDAGLQGWRKQKPRLDSAAAQILLLQYFESAKNAAS